ncbi:MAG: hypothetical protein ABI891_11195, partial [Acidobacteriota bacterium]
MFRGFFPVPAPLVIFPAPFENQPAPRLIALVVRNWMRLKIPFAAFQPTRVRLLFTPRQLRSARFEQLPRLVYSNPF